MKTDNDPIEKVLDKLIASTRSPRGRFSAANSWKLLEARMKKQRIRRTLWMRAASAAAVVLLCVASWAMYHALTLTPASPAPATEAPAPRPEETRSTLVFRQQPLQEIVSELSRTFHTDIRIEDDSLKNYRMTATFDARESLTEILDLLKEAGNFEYKQTNDHIIITKLD